MYTAATISQFHPPTTFTCRCTLKTSETESQPRRLSNVQMFKGL